MVRQTNEPAKWQNSPSPVRRRATFFVTSFYNSWPLPGGGGFQRLGSRSVEVLRVDRLAGKAQLQHLQALRAIEHFAWENPLYEHPESAEEDPEDEGQSAEKQCTEKNILEHDHPGRIRERLRRLIPRDLRAVVDALPEHIGRLGGTRSQHQGKQRAAPDHRGSRSCRVSGEGAFEVVQVLLGELRRGILDQQQHVVWTSAEPVAAHHGLGAGLEADLRTQAGELAALERDEGGLKSRGPQGIALRPLHQSVFRKKIANRREGRPLRSFLQGIYQRLQVRPGNIRRLAQIHHKIPDEDQHLRFFSIDGGRNFQIAGVQAHFELRGVRFVRGAWVGIFLQLYGQGLRASGGVNSRLRGSRSLGRNRRREIQGGSRSARRRGPLADLIRQELRLRRRGAHRCAQHENQPGCNEKPAHPRPASFLDTRISVLVAGFLFASGDTGARGDRCGPLVDGHAVQALEVIGHALVNAFGDLLPFQRLFKLLFVPGIAQEGDLREDRRHVRADQHHERRLADAAVLGRAGGPENVLAQRNLNVLSEFAGLVDFLRTRNVAYQILKIVNSLVGSGIFARGHFHSFGRAAQVQVVGFDAARILVWAGIGVNRDEQISLCFVGDAGAFLQGNKRVVGARVDHVRAWQTLANDVSEAQRHIEAKILFHQTTWADGAGVVASMAGVDHDAADFKTERAGESGFAVARRLRCAGRSHVR